LNAPHVITEDVVIDYCATIPAFPAIICSILATIDDEDANLNMLVDHIRQDPLITARILSVANRSSNKTRSLATSNIFTACSMIGTGRVRELTVLNSLAGFADKLVADCTSSLYWQHSVSVGVCSEELARYSGLPAPGAQITGLLHDIGHLWLNHYNQNADVAAWQHALDNDLGIVEVQRDRFGVDHAVIGAWLTAHWGLPPDITAAVLHHHAPEAALDEPMVPLIHVAEVLSNALDLTGRHENMVTRLSTKAFQKIGLELDSCDPDVNAGVQALFGRIVARSEHANARFT
jgi:putative nucleotidyltransferase with HDIG domain